MNGPIPRGEFCKRGLLICLTTAIFAAFIAGYAAVMKHAFDVTLSDQAMNFIIATATNIFLFVYVRYAVIPRLLARGKSAIVSIVMHLPLIVYVNVAVISYDLDASIFDDLGLNILGGAGVSLAIGALFEAATMPDKVTTAPGQPD